MARARLTVKAELLRWARETAGMTIPVAAGKIGITEERLAAWEDRGGDPTPRQLEKIADVFKRPTAAFFLRERPVEPALPVDFRLPMPGARGRLSTDTLFALRRARRLQDAFADLLATAPSPELPPLALEDDASVVASEARRMLGVTIEEQMTFHTPRKAIPVWRRALEGRGTLTFRFSIPKEEVRAFSLAGGPPVIVLSGDDYDSSQIFSLFHEWAHLCLGQPGMCLPEIDSRAADAGGQVERFCNQFAADLLVPRDALLAEETTQQLREKRLAVADALRVLSRVFAVSRYVILRRLRTLRLVSEAEFRRVDRLLAGEYEKEMEKREREKQKAKEEGEESWGPPPPIKVVSQLGRAFVTHVLDAHERGAIHYADIADLLAVRLKHLPRIQELVS